MNAKLVLISGSTVTYLGNAPAVAGGAILPAPITRWRGGEWDARTFSSDRLAIVPEDWANGRNVTAEIPAILDALSEYAEDDEIADTITAIRERFEVANAN